MGIIYDEAHVKKKCQSTWHAMNAVLYKHSKVVAAEFAICEPFDGLIRLMHNIY